MGEGMTIKDRIRYEMTFGPRERYERAADKACMWLARRLPRRLLLWTLVCRHADVTAPDQHPDTVSAFDLVKGL